MIPPGPLPSSVYITTCPQLAKVDVRVGDDGAGFDPQQTLGFGERVAWLPGLRSNDAATSRTQTRKRSTTGLSVRFFNVTIAIRLGICVQINS
jgi:hypothetical protein